MKLILSRKGFDSSAGGCPNPRFSDDSLLALPIPDSRSRIRYADVCHTRNTENYQERLDVGELVADLTGNRLQPEDGAHLDPDMLAQHLPRRSGWRPLLGQSGAAQGHLRKQGVSVGDVFLYFALFRAVEFDGGHWRFIKRAPAQHILWGWMQIDQVLTVDELDVGEGLSQGPHRWLDYHPHCHGEPDPNNTLYLSAERLKIRGRDTGLPGHGVFDRVIPARMLTDPAATSPSFWRLPRWFFPEGSKTPLSYHARADRWSRDQRHCYLRSAARGQEFVLDTGGYPRAIAWLRKLIEG